MLYPLSYGRISRRPFPVKNLHHDAAALCRSGKKPAAHASDIVRIHRPGPIPGTAFGVP